VLAAFEQRIMRYKKILENTKGFHEYCIHIILDDFCNSTRLTFPSILSVEIIGASVEKFFETTHSAARRSEVDKTEAERVAALWPEYVLPPSNPLSFLGPDMPCPFFGVK